jgi:MFS family permease
MHLKKYRAYIIAFCATIVRYYDYSLFGLSAALLSQNLMPKTQEDKQILVFFALFSLSMCVRPLGSILFGRIGDQVGRVASVKIAMSVAAISTGLIAIIPSFEKLGWWSVLLLFACRMLFLLSLAGEIDAIRIYVSEKIDKRKRNFAMGIISFSSQVGVLLASVMYYVAVSFEEITWLWRFNFFLGGLLGLGIVLLRRHLEESEIFLRSKRSSRGKDLDLSIISIIKRNKIQFLLASTIHGMLGGTYHFLIIFLGTFAANVAGIESQEQAMSGNIGIIALYSLACLLSGFIADKVNILVQATVAIICSIICVAALTMMFNFGVFSQYLHYILAALAPFYIVPCIMKTQSLFKTTIRMRMFSISHSVGSLLFSSTTPFMCMLIWRWSDSFFMVFSYFLIQLLILFLALGIATRKHYFNSFEI